MADPSASPNNHPYAFLASVDRVVAGLLAYDPEQIILFGSGARGHANKRSDIDLIIVKKTDRKFGQRVVEVKAFLPAGLSIDAIVYTPEEFESMVETGNPFMDQALGDGKVLYDRASGVRKAAVAPPTKWSWEGGIAFVFQPLATARRWLRQGERSLAVTRLLMHEGFWSDVCFHSQQTAQMALKAFLHLTGHRPLLTHSVGELVQQCAEEHSEFQVFTALSAEVEEYYVTTRYPDAVDSPAVPFEMFIEKQACEALGYAQEIVETVRAKVEAAGGLSQEPDQGPESL